MLTFTDLTGRKFGKWTVLHYTRNAPTRFLCRCECGTEKEVRAGNLTNDSSTSCGCDRGEKVADKLRTHGHSGTPIYRVWVQMKKRCNNPRDKSYPDYGAKGVKVCARWMQSFADFLADMGERPSDAHSIDRVDANKGYEPGNCVWATDDEQNRHKSSNVYATIDGRKMVLKDACEAKGLPYDAVRARIARGWSMDRALTTPLETAGGRQR